jgi:hypothetical protein
MCSTTLSVNEPRDGDEGSGPVGSERVMEPVVIAEGRVPTGSLSVNDPVAISEGVGMGYAAG